MITDQTQLQCYLLTSQWSVPGAQEPRDKWDSSPATSGDPGGGGIRAMPPNAQPPGANIYFAPKPESGPLDPLGPLDEVDFLSGFRVPWDGSGPCGKHQASA